MVPFRVKALYEYTSPHEDDLTFDAGQIITVTEEEDDDWYNGYYTKASSGAKREGIFPRNFVEKIPEPMAPPRPSRSRSKKDPNPPLPSTTSPVAAAPPVPASALQEPLEEPTPAPAPVPPKPVEQPTSAVPAPARKASNPVAASATTATASVPKPKPSPPPVSEKPSSFKDRIAAFNKSAAPPVAPFKPGGLGTGTGAGPSFIKKPFVAPPPSRNAYVPTPQQAPVSKVYRREEDPEIKDKEAENQEQAEKAGLVAHDNSEGLDDGDQPKPTTLKERIALLQQQQKEQAARHADAAAKKEKPKKPAKKAEVPSVPAHTDDAGVADEETAPTPSLPRRSTEGSSTRASTESSRAPAPQRRRSTKGTTVESVHDGNEADMSGAGDTTEGHDDTTEREDNVESPQRLSRAATGSTTTGGVAEKIEEPQDEGGDEEEAEDDEDVDPEVKRKEELRARMAKMSGGMGFHGMFGMAPPASAPAKKKKPSKAEAAEEETGETSRAAPPIPTMIAIPGMGGPRRSEEMARHSEDEQQSPIARAPPPPPVPARQDNTEDEEDDETTPALTPAPTSMFYS